MFMTVVQHSTIPADIRQSLSYSNVTITAFTLQFHSGVTDIPLHSYMTEMDYSFDTKLGGVLIVSAPVPSSPNTAQEITKKTVVIGNRKIRALSEVFYNTNTKEILQKTDHTTSREGHCPHQADCIFQNL